MSALLFVGFSVLAVAIIGCVLIARQLRPGTTFRDCDECPVMVVIPAGNFVMGDSHYGHPPHRVKISRPFAVAMDMITRDEYAEFVAESRYSASAWREICDRKQSRRCMSRSSVVMSPSIRMQEHGSVAIHFS